MSHAVLYLASTSARRLPYRIMFLLCVSTFRFRILTVCQVRISFHQSAMSSTVASYSAGPKALSMLWYCFQKTFTTSVPSPWASPVPSCRYWPCNHLHRFTCDLA